MSIGIYLLIIGTIGFVGGMVQMALIRKSIPVAARELDELWLN